MDNYLAQFKTIILIVIPKKKGAKIKQKCSFKELIDYVYVIIPCTFSNINCFQYVPKISFNYCIKNDKSNILTWILMNMINGKQFMYYSNLSHPYYSQLHICWKYIYMDWQLSKHQKMLLDFWQRFREREREREREWFFFFLVGNDQNFIKKATPPIHMKCTRGSKRERKWFLILKRIQKFPEQ